MTTNLHRIQVGQPIPDRAEYWNQFVDAADYANTQRDKQGSEATDELPYATAALMKKSASGAVFERGQAVALDSSLNDSTTNLSLFLDRPIFTARTSESLPDFGRIAVTYESTDEGEIGYSFPTGIAVVRLHEKENETQCEFADVFDTASTAPAGVDSKYMQTHWSGSWEIVYRDMAAGGAGEGRSGYAIVVQKGLHQRELKAVTESTIVPGGSGNVSVWINGADTSAEVVAHFNWIEDDAAPIPGSTEVLIKWFADELKWVIIGKPPVGTEPAVFSEARKAFSLSSPWDDGEMDLDWTANGITLFLDVPLGIIKPKILVQGLYHISCTVTICGWHEPQPETGSTASGRNILTLYINGGPSDSRHLTEVDVIEYPSDRGRADNNVSISKKLSVGDEISFHINTPNKNNGHGDNGVIICHAEVTFEGTGVP